MKKSILLTGSNGFLGSHLLQSLYEAEKFKIYACLREKSNLARVRNLFDTDIEFVKIDSYEMDKFFQDNHIDIIIHTATNYGKETRGDNKYSGNKPNIPFKTPASGY